MSRLRPASLLFPLLTSGCALFGDPLLGTWNLLEADAYGPLTSTTTGDDQVSTTTTISGKLVLDTLEDGDIFGHYTETTTVTQVGPEINETTSEDNKVEVEAIEEERDLYELDVDTVGDWLCAIEGSQLDCEDDDLDSYLFERVGEGEK